MTTVTIEARDGDLVPDNNGTIIVVQWLALWLAPC